VGRGGVCALGSASGVSVSGSVLVSRGGFSQVGRLRCAVFERHSAGRLSAPLGEVDCSPWGMGVMFISAFPCSYVRIKAIHDVDLIDALKRLGVYEGVRSGVYSCIICGKR